MPKDWAHPTSSRHHRTFKHILPASRHVRPSKSFIPCIARCSAKLIKASHQRAIVIHHRADGRSSDSSIVPTGAYLIDCCVNGRSTKSSIAPICDLQELLHRRGGGSLSRVFSRWYQCRSRIVRVIDPIAMTLRRSISQSALPVIAKAYHPILPCQG